MAQHTPGTSLNIVDLSQADKRVSPNLIARRLSFSVIQHGQSVSVPGSPASRRFKDHHRRRWRDRQFVCAEQPISGKPLVGHERQS